MKLMNYGKPYAPAKNYSSIFGDIFSDFFSDAMTRSNSDWPKVDIEENEKEYVFNVDLPGIKKEDVNIELNGDVLVISGEKKEEKSVEERKYHLKESFCGTFRRSFKMPDAIDSEKSEASFENGILTLKVPKSDASKTRKIEIK